VLNKHEEGRLIVRPYTRLSSLRYRVTRVFRIKTAHHRKHISDITTFSPPASFNVLFSHE